MKIILESKMVDGVPLLEYYQENYKHKSLVFVQHGYESTKEYGADYLAVNLARRGYYVVAIDAYKHGERIEEPFISGTEIEKLEEVMKVINFTAIDIIRIHRNYYLKQFPTFDMIGVSLGGMIAYFLATKTKRLNTLIPVISTPDFKTQAIHAIRGASLDPDSFFTSDAWEFIESLNPISHVNEMSYNSLHVFIGLKDQIVPFGPSIEFFEKYKTNKDTYHEYQCDHAVPREMQQDIFTVLDNVYHK